MNRKVLIAAVALVVLAIAVWAIVANNSSDETKQQTNTASHSNNDQTTSESDSQTSQVQTDSKNVNIIDFAYSPANITVKVGDTVTWTNMDSVDHTVTVTNGEGPDSELFGKGETYSYTFTKAGKYEYFCKPHPNMVGSVTVE